MTAPFARPIALKLAAGVLFLLALSGGPALGVTHLKSGQVPPPIALDTLAGQRFTLESAHGRPLVLIFGELYHERTLRACGEIRSVLESEALSDHAVASALVIAQDAPIEQLKADAAKDQSLPPTILHDVTRKAYGDYRVSVMPSVVIINGEGRVVHAVPGYTARLKDIVADAVKVASGEMSAERFEQLLHPAEESIDESQVKAARISSLARQLARRGLDAMAEEKYAEALGLAPKYAPAQLGLAMLMLRKSDLARAEAAFRTAMDTDPKSVEASLGLAYVQTLRGGDELADARDVVLGVLQADPEEPRAYYLLGLIHQQRAETDDAIAAFRKASELLMARRESWNLIPGNLNDEPE